MTAIVSTDRSNRSAHSVFGNMSCAYCGGSVIAPEWSACVSERQIHSLWWCTKCAYVFETSVYFSADSVAEISEKDMEKRRLISN